MPQIPINQILKDDNFNCRKDVTPFSVMELAKSIKEQGLLQPIAVQPIEHPNYKYRIILGHRRYLACIQNNATHIECIIKEGLNDTDALTLNVVENIQRKDLNMLEEALAIERFLKMGDTFKQVASRLNKSIGWVQVRSAILSLPEDLRKEVAAGLFSTDNLKSMKTLSVEDKYEFTRRLKDSKIKGNKFKPAKVKRKRKIDPLEKKAIKHDVLALIQESIYDQIGANEYTRTLAWANGHISTIDFLEDVQTRAKSDGKVFKIPKDLIDETYIPTSMQNV
jgi:ParB family chromosome partitioning protein